MGEKPLALAKKPKLLPELEFAFSVFSELRPDCHDYMAGRCRIKLRDFMDYAELYQFTRLDIQKTWPRISLLQSLWNTETKNRQPKATT